MVSRQGVALTEVLVGVALLGLVVACLAPLLSGGVDAAANAGESQQIVTIASRAMDRLQAVRHDLLRAADGRDTPMDGAWLGLATDPSGATTRAVEVRANGFSITGRYRVDVIDPCMVRLSVTLCWRKIGSSAGSGSSFTFVRLAADPLLSVAARGAGE